MNPTDRLDQFAEQRKILSDVNEDDVSSYILDLLKKDIHNRDAFGWGYMKQYEVYSYDGYKNRKDGPWKNSSNYSVRLTSTLLDTAHANVMAGIFADDRKVVTATGIGPEDVRTEKGAEAILNWQILNDIQDSFDVLDKTIHLAFKHGNAVIKCIQGYNGMQKSKVVWDKVPIENIFLPIDFKGAQPHQVDHIFELIPLTLTQKKFRENLKDRSGKLIYDGLKDIAVGNKIYGGMGTEQITRAKDVTSGTSLGDRYSRDMYYILECYLTYWHKIKDTENWVPLELLVTLSPSGGDVLRMDINTDLDEDTGLAVRPYALGFIPYPRDDRGYGDSLPWLIKQSQEELDYAHNQNMDAADELIKPPKFYDPSCGWDPETTEAVPNGWYPVPNPVQNVFIPTLNFNPIFERSFDRYWEYAQRQTGLTELFQGRSQTSARTLGEAELRINKTEVRFKTIYKRLEKGFKELVWLTYYYDKKYMPDEVKVKVLGTSDFQSIKELFPEGVSGKYNFSFSSDPLTEKERESREIESFYLSAMGNPLISNNPANQWRLLNLLAGVKGIRNLESIVGKPREANILFPQDAIQRIMSGQYDIMPDPGIDTQDYELRIAMFMKSETFADATPQEQQGIQLLMRRVLQIRIGQQRAYMDAHILNANTIAQNMMGGNSGPAGPTSVPAGTGGNGNGIQQGR